jgi:hypothetical protein
MISMAANSLLEKRPSLSRQRTTDVYIHTKVAKVYGLAV